MTKSRQVVVVKAKGGMGNRMLCAVTGILYAQLSGRKVFMDWRDGAYGAYGQNVFGEFFKTLAGGTEECPSGNLHVNPSIWHKNLDQSVSNMIEQHYPKQHSSFFIHRKLSIDVRRLDYPEDAVVFWNYQHRINGLQRHLAGRLNQYVGLAPHGILAKALQDVLPLQDTIWDIIQEFKEAFFKRPTIGVHIRYTDRKTRLAAYEKALAHFFKRSPDAQIFLATDNADILNAYSTRYAKVISTPKWYPSSSSTMHQSRECPDRIQNGVEALKDMYLLSMCDRLIYSSWSTFSFISRLLSNLPEDKVADIDRYNIPLRVKQWLRDTLP